MRFAFYRRARDNEPQVVDLADDEVVALVRASTEFACSPADCVGKECPNKDTELFSPVDIDGPRHNSSVRSMSMLVLEVDGVPCAAAVRVAEALAGLRHGVYSTHSHRGGDGRWSLRFLVWLSRPVRVAYRRAGKGSIPTAEDEWHRFYASALRRLGIADLLDQHSDPARIWYVPGHCRGVEPVAGYDDGAPLDVDAVLADAPRQNVAPPPAATPAARPSPPETSPEFTDLDDVAAMLSEYRRSRAQRDDAEEREKGALVGRLLDGEPLAAPGGNAQPTPVEPPADLPRGRGIAILRTSGICVNVLPPSVPDEAYLELFRRSIEAMRFGGPEGEREALYAKLHESLARNRARRQAWEAEREVDRARMRALAERLASRGRPAAPPSAPPPAATVEAPAAAAEAEDPDAWRGMLRRKGKGALVACGFNAYLILLYDPELRAAARWDDVNNCLVTAGPLAGETEVAGEIAANFMSAKYDVDVEPSTVYRQLLCVAYDNRFDPIRDYLRSLSWDGRPRIEAGGGWLARYAGVDPSADGYVLDVGRRWLVQAVARALDPGCKADSVLLLEGGQGRRKSSMLRALGGEWFCAVQHLVLGDKDSKMLAAGNWIIELAEMASLRRSEKRAIKAFFSDDVDKFRLPFGRKITRSPRRGVFVATTNDDGDDLDDITGNRRYWPVRCGQIDLLAIIRDRGQLWAEAVHLYDRHLADCADKLHCGCWWFAPDDQRVLERTDDRLVETVAETPLEAWWYGIAPERRPKAVTSFDAAVASLGCSKDRVNRNMQMDVGEALRKLGFRKGVVKIAGRKSKRVFVPSEELLAAPQSEEGKQRDQRAGLGRSKPDAPRPN